MGQFADLVDKRVAKPFFEEYGKLSNAYYSGKTWAYWLRTRTNRCAECWLKQRLDDQDVPPCQRCPMTKEGVL